MTRHVLNLDHTARKLQTEVGPPHRLTAELTICPRRLKGCAQTAFPRRIIEVMPTFLLWNIPDVAEDHSDHKSNEKENVGEIIT